MSSIVRILCLPALCVIIVVVCGCVSTNRPVISKLELIRPGKDGASFAGSDSGQRFTVWGVNYDHDRAGRLLEDYWWNEWTAVEQDFQEIKELGANVVRIHLQLARFMNTPKEANAASLKQLARLVRLAEKTQLYLDVTGLGCYNRKDVPAWYEAMTEAERWDVQAVFWQAVARVCSGSSSIFCYDLMNEPILPGREKKESGWLGDEFAGKCFVQRISLDLAGRSREEVAGRWVKKLVSAIKTQDKNHMVTVGEIPWALVFPGAKPFFSSKEVGPQLDFASVHFYPKKGEVARALTALAVYDTGKPLVVEEMFPLTCGIDEIDAFVEGSRKFADGWIGFYWGETVDEYSNGPVDIGAAITRGWLEYFSSKASAILGKKR